MKLKINIENEFKNRIENEFENRIENEFENRIENEIKNKIKMKLKIKLKLNWNPISKKIWFAKFLYATHLSSPNWLKSIFKKGILGAFK